LAAIRSVATAGEPGEILFFFVRYDFADLPSAKFHEIRTRHVDRCRMKTFGTKF